MKFLRNPLAQKLTKESRVFVYAPRIPKEAYLALEQDNFVNRFFNGAVSLALHHLSRLYAVFFIYIFCLPLPVPPLFRTLPFVVPPCNKMLYRGDESAPLSSGTGHNALSVKLCWTDIYPTRKVSGKVGIKARQTGRI